MQSIPLNNGLNLSVETKRKSKLIPDTRWHHKLIMFFFFQTKASRNSQQWFIRVPYHCFRQPKENGRYGCEGSFSRGGKFHCVEIGLFLAEIVIAVECSNSALGQKPRTTRGIVTVIAKWGIRCASGYGSCRTWY